MTLQANLDFEDTTNGNSNLIECTVTARDRDGSGLTNTEITIISITVTDLVDERPRFVVSVTSDIFVTGLTFWVSLCVFVNVLGCASPDPASGYFMMFYECLELVH